MLCKPKAGAVDWLRTTVCLLWVLSAAAQPRSEYEKWEATGLLGVLPPPALDRSPIAVQVRARLSLLKLREAQEDAATLRSFEPQNYEGYFWTGFIELQASNWYSAVKHLRQAERLRPRGNAVQKVLGLVYLQLGQNALAELKLRQAIELDPADFSPHYCLGRYLQSQRKRHEEAAAHYRLVIERKPDHYEALYYLGLAAETAGDAAQAETLYRRSLSIPEGSNRKFSLPYAGLSRLARQANDLESARKFAIQAVLLDPNLADSQLELAKAYVALGQLPEAIEAFKATLALDGTQSAAYYRLYSLYRRLGDGKAAEQAMSEFNKTVACYGKDP